jgi:hypothetical protein
MDRSNGMDSALAAKKAEKDWLNLLPWPYIILNGGGNLE